jgi:hypothetical protein
MLIVAARNLPHQREPQMSKKRDRQLRKRADRRKKQKDAARKVTQGDSLDIAAAQATSERLLKVCDRFPLSVKPGNLTPQGDAELDNWDLVAPALLFTGATCVLSIHALGQARLPRRGTQDAFVLLRRLYEHAVTFAWIAIDPANNVRAWLAKDYSYRLKANRELTTLGHKGLTPATEAKYDAYVKATPKLMPDVLARAHAADKHWSALIDLHGRKTPLPSNKFSFEALYTIIYRAASGDAHPTAGGLHHWVHGRGGGEFAIGVSPVDHGERFPFTLAPIVFAQWLLVSEHVLGWPESERVVDAFGEWTKLDLPEESEDEE